MIFERGVRFIRFISSSVSGLASGSLMAAACFSASLIASRRLQSCLVAVAFLPVLFMVPAPLMGLCFSRRNDPLPLFLGDRLRVAECGSVLLRRHGADTAPLRNCSRLDRRRSV